MYVLQDQTPIHTYSKNYQTWSSKRRHEKPAGVQQTYPSLLKSTRWVEDIFLFNREVSLDVLLLHCNVCSDEDTWLHAGMCYLCWLDPHGMKRHITDQWGQALLVGQYCEFPTSTTWELRTSLWCNIFWSLGSVRWIVLKGRLSFLPLTIKEARRLAWDGYIILV